MGETVDDINPFSGERMLRRLDVRKPEQMWLDATFEIHCIRTGPVGLLRAASLGSVIERLRSHGIRMERLDQPTTALLEEFHIAASQVAAQAFEKHQERHRNRTLRTH